MTHSVLEILVTCLISALALWANHGSPWRRWLGKKLSRAAKSTMGMMALLMPVAMLYLYWQSFPPEGEPFVMALAALAGDVAASLLMRLVLAYADRGSVEEMQEDELTQWRMGEERLEEILDGGREYRGRNE